MGRPLREVVSWNAPCVSSTRTLSVDLFVRSWVEIKVIPQKSIRLRSTSSWGRELKLFSKIFLHNKNRRPLREVVSWNVISEPKECPIRRSTSSWGRELKYPNIKAWMLDNSRPLREVVSWNIRSYSYLLYRRVDLFVRSWVEMYD